MTHEYTILTGGIIRAAGAAQAADAAQAAASTPPTALAWAEDTVLAVGDDATVRAISRGDSHFHDLGGAVVVPLGEALEPGAAANFAVLDGERASAGVRPQVIAVVRGGRVVEGALP